MKASASQDYILKGLPWDSEMLGISSGQLILGDSEAKVPETSGIQQCLEEARRQGYRFLTVKLPAERLSDLNFILSRGGKIMDAELTFFNDSWQGDDLTLSGKITIDKHKSFWDDSLFELAEDLNLSRFYMDEQIPTEKALTLWRTSIQNHCQGRASYTIVAKVDQKPAGILCVNDHNGVSDLFIVGVLRKFRGRSIAKQMIRYYMDHLDAKITRLTVETQASNYSAISLYQSAGYRLLKVKYITHLWL